MINKITHNPKNDGFGSQYQHIICVLLISRHNGWQYLYNPIKKMDHNYNNEELFIQKIEHAMNIKPFFEICNEERIQHEQIYVFDTNAKFIVDDDIIKYATKESLEWIKNMFWNNKIKDNKIIFNNEDVINVAVHIRRPNPHDNRTQGSDTPDNYYLNVLNIIRKKNENTKIQFHIYSQGEASLFEKYIANDTIFHLNEDLVATFIAMVASDILVTSFSSYSYIAAFLNDGIVYYHPFWHPPLNHWIVCHDQ
jgi:hypothetical protein